MRVIEQVAIRTNDIARRIKDIGPMYPFCGSLVQKADQTKWVQDRVHAVHVYLHPDYMRAPIGSAFDVLLAFNYDLIPGRELELIQLLSGDTVQLVQGEGEGLSHFGYHIPDKAQLISELEWWNEMGYVVTQVSVTTSHEATKKRYMYAFIDTRQQIGVYTKVISRVTYPRQLESLVEEFQYVNRART